MKYLFLLYISLFISVTTVNAQDGWVTHKGDNRISVKFPTTPRELTPGSFIALGNDSTAYVLTIFDFAAVANLDSVALAPMKNTPEFAAQIKTSMKESLPDVIFADFIIGTWKGFTCYNSVGVDSKKKKYDVFMFIIGSKLYSVSTVTAAGVSNTGRDKFVNSIVLSN